MNLNKNKNKIRKMKNNEKRKKIGRRLKGMNNSEKQKIECIEKNRLKKNNV